MSPEDIAKLPYRPCVGVMLINSQDQVFVGQRIDSPYDAWQMPQGGIDPGEAPGDAAFRELGEETGIPPSLVTVEAETEDWIPYDLPHDLVPKLWKGRFKGQEQKWFLFRFHGEDSDVNIETEHQEFSQWKWLDPQDLPDAIVSFKRKTYEKVLADFAPHL